MKSVFLFIPLCHIIFVGLMVISGANQHLATPISDASNPLFTSYPQTVKDLEKYNTSNIQQVSPYLNDTGVSGATTSLSPLGYIKDGVNFYAQMATLKIRTGDSYADAIIYFFFFGPVLGVFILYGILMYVRGIR